MAWYLTKLFPTTLKTLLYQTILRPIQTRKWRLLVIKYLFNACVNDYQFYFLKTGKGKYVAVKWKRMND